MNKKEMVQAVLDKGMLISPDILDRLNEDTLRSILMNGNKAAEKNGLVVEAIPQPPTSETADINPPKEKQEMPRKPDISIKTRKTDSIQKLNPQDCIKYYNNKYNSLKNILLKKTSATSINKTNNNPGTVTIIGMVKERGPNGLMLEDPTGTIETVLNPTIDNRNMAEDDVLAISGGVREGKLFAKEIALPDVPLTHPVGEIDATMLLTEKMPSKDQNSNTNVDIICAPEEMKIGDNGTKLTNPAMIEITKQGKTIRLLVYKPEKETGLSTAVELLKKRHLSPQRNQVFSSVTRDDHDPFLIDPIPDIFWLISHEKGTTIYKGVTIISFNQNNAAMVDLKTRKVEFIGNSSIPGTH
jgi:DNA polymerase II small subunit/DNA polymerase delta subunit B